MQGTKKKTFKSPTFTVPSKSDSQQDVGKDNEQFIKKKATDEKNNVSENKMLLSLNVTASTPKDPTHDLQKESNKEKSEKPKTKKIKLVDNDDSEKEKKKMKLREESKTTIGDLSEVPYLALRKHDDAPTKSKKEKKKLLMRSLSDEEYKELFEAVIQIVVSTDSVDDKTVKPVTIIDKEETLGGQEIDGDYKDEPSTNIDKKLSANNLEKVIYDDVEQRMNEIKEELDAEEEEEEKENKEESVKENNHVDNEVIEDDVHDHQDPESMEDMQQKNEMTPIGSDFEFDQSIPIPSSKQVKPAHKKKKKRSNVKKSTLHPHHLPFSDGENNKSSLFKEEKRIKNLQIEKLNTAKKEKFSNLVHLHKQKRRRETKRDEKRIKKKGQSRKKIMLERNIDCSGTWIQCCNPSCQKWRYLSHIQDPTNVPEQWFCNMNTNENFNSCDKIEEEYNESDHIFTKFTEGSIVWVKMPGYPWWPAMVEIDPDTEYFFTVESTDSIVPTHYHVVFLDKHVSRAWIKARYIKAFTGKDDVEVAQKTVYEKDIAVAKESAFKALVLDLQDRIRQFGFAGRFRGKWKSYSLGGNSQESLGSPIIKKKIKPKLRKIYKDNNVESDTEGELSLEMIDEPIINDLLNNTDSILEDMELVLESLESESPGDDSENIGIKGKQKKQKDSYRLQQKKVLKKMNIEDGRRDKGVSKERSTTLKRKADEYSSAQKMPRETREILWSKDRAYQKKKCQSLGKEETSNLLTDDVEVMVKNGKHESVIDDTEMLQININKRTPKEDKECKPDQIVMESLKFDTDVFTMELSNSYNDIKGPDVKSCEKKNQRVKDTIKKKNDVMDNQSTSKGFELANDVTLEPESWNHNVEVLKSFNKLNMEHEAVCFDKAIVDIDISESKSDTEIETNSYSLEKENKKGVQEDTKENEREGDIVKKPKHCDKGEEGKKNPRNGDKSTHNKPSKKMIMIKRDSPEEGQSSGKKMKQKISKTILFKNSELKFNKMEKLIGLTAVNDGSDGACLEPKISDTTNKKEVKQKGKVKSFKTPSSVCKITVNSLVGIKKCDLAKCQESKEEADKERDFQDGKFQEKVEQDIGEEITYDLNSQKMVDTQIKVSNENDDESDDDFDIDTSLYNSEPGSIKQNILIQIDNNADHNDSDPFEMIEE